MIMNWRGGEANRKQRKNSNTVLRDDLSLSSDLNPHCSWLKWLRKWHVLPNSTLAALCLCIFLWHRHYCSQHVRQTGHKCSGVIQLSLNKSISPLVRTECYRALTHSDMTTVWLIKLHRNWRSRGFSSLVSSSVLYFKKLLSLTVCWKRNGVFDMRKGTSAGLLLHKTAMLDRSWSDWCKGSCRKRTDGSAHLTLVLVRGHAVPGLPPEQQSRGLLQSSSSPSTLCKHTILGH